MIYAYIRVSTDKQEFDGQVFALNQYAKLHNLVIDEIIEEKVSGKVPREKRDLGRLVERLQKGDILITPELSRLGRSTADTVVTIDLLNKKEIIVHFIKENLISGTPNYEFMTTMYAGLAAMERQRISERTKEALRARKAQGMIIGHYKGFKCTNVKLTKHSDEILKMLESGASISAICKQYNVKWTTARNFIRDRLKYDLNKIKTCREHQEKKKKIKG